MTFVVHESTTVTLRPGETGFQLRDQFTIANRAGFEISTLCPDYYSNIIAECINKGWLRPVAVVPKTDPTYTWDILKDD